jgi:hypothetical protein
LEYLRQNQMFQDIGMIPGVKGVAVTEHGGAGIGADLRRKMGKGEILTEFGKKILPGMRQTRAIAYVNNIRERGASAPQ